MKDLYIPKYPDIYHKCNASSHNICNKYVNAKFSHHQTRPIISAVISHKTFIPKRSKTTFHKYQTLTFKCNFLIA